MKCYFVDPNLVFARCIIVRYLKTHAIFVEHCNLMVKLKYVSLSGTVVRNFSHAVMMSVNHRMMKRY